MTDPSTENAGGVLAGLKVLDLSHHYSAAFAGVLLADLGADVTLVEHPSGNVLRGMLPQREEVPLWTSLVERNKSNVSLKLSDPEGRRIFLELASRYDVIIENFRPGTLERWGLGPDDLTAAGVDAVMLRVSGYGQNGPRSPRPGFGGAAEAMSGLTQMTGSEDGTPFLLSTAIADGAAGAFGVIGLLAALWQRVRARAEGIVRTAGVEVVDIALFEAMFRLIPTQVIEYDQCGTIPGRAGSVREHGVIRGVYRSADGIHFCVSSVGPRAIGRMMSAVAAEGLIAELDNGILDTGEASVVDYITRCDNSFAGWAAALPWTAVEKALDHSGVVCERVYTVADIVTDEHYLAREDIITVPVPALGDVRMPGVVPKFSGFKHDIRHAGREIGADNAAIYGELLGMGGDQLAALHQNGVI